MQSQPQRPRVRPNAGNNSSPSPNLNSSPNFSENSLAPPNRVSVRSQENDHAGFGYILTSRIILTSLCPFSQMGHEAPLVNIGPTRVADFPTLAVLSSEPRLLRWTAAVNLVASPCRQVSHLPLRPPQTVTRIHT